jgi:oligopeptidase B
LILAAAAEQRPYSYERHGVTIEDPVALAARSRLSRRSSDPDVLAYLKAENAYFEAAKRRTRR